MLSRTTALNGSSLLESTSNVPLNPARATHLVHLGGSVNNVHERGGTRRYQQLAGRTSLRPFTFGREGVGGAAGTYLFTD